MSGVIGSLEVRSATPRARTHVYSGVWTAATTPGASLSEKDCSNAASRASSGACPLSPIVILTACSVSSVVVVVSSAESCSWLPLPPPQLLTSIAANKVRKSPLSHLSHLSWCIPRANIPHSFRPVDHLHGATGRNLALPIRPSFREDPSSRQLMNRGQRGLSYRLISTSRTHASTTATRNDRTTPATSKYRPLTPQLSTAIPAATKGSVATC